MVHRSRLITFAQTFTWTVFALVTSSTLFAQNDLGLPNFGTSESHQYETINLQNLNIVVHIPVRNKSAHYPMSYSITANNNLYKFTNRQGTVEIRGGFALAAGSDSPEFYF